MIDSTVPRWWWIGWLWMLPNSILALLLMLASGSKPVRWNRRVGVMEFEAGTWLHHFYVTKPWRASSMGCIIVFQDEQARLDARLRGHEYRHCWQSHIFGPLLGIAYPLSSLIAWAEDGDWYRDNAFEQQAREWPWHP